LQVNKKTWLNYAQNIEFHCRMPPVKVPFYISKKEKIVLTDSAYNVTLRMYVVKRCTVYTDNGSVPSVCADRRALHIWEEKWLNTRKLH